MSNTKNPNKNRNLEINWFGEIWWKRDIADQNKVPRATFCRWWKKYDGDCVAVKKQMEIYKVTKGGNKVRDLKLEDLNCMKPKKRKQNEEHAKMPTKYERDELGLEPLESSKVNLSRPYRNYS